MPWDGQSCMKHNALLPCPDCAITVLVCGSRSWADAAAIRIRLASIGYAQRGDVTILHGDARGADRMAARIARDLGMYVKTYPADWQKHGKRAGFLRNITMLDQEPDLVLAFHDGQSRGTQHTIDQARKRGIPVEVITERSQV